MGYRIYIVEGDAITPVAQKTFHDFFNEAPALPAYSGRTLTFAVAFCEVENRRPARPLRLTTLLATVKKDGSLDQDEHRRRIADMISAIDTEDPGEGTIANKRHENRWSPKISENAYRRILAHLKIQESVVSATAA